MVSKNMVISNPSGLHARPAALLAQAAGKCKSDVILVYGEKRIQAKSVLNIMAAAIKRMAARLSWSAAGKRKRKIYRP